MVTMTTALAHTAITIPSTPPQLVLLSFARSARSASWRMLPMQLAAASCNTSSSEPTLSATG
jgi:hypothetical protein